MSKVKDFLTKEEQEKLARMISEAEAFTNAELRIHLEAYCKIDVIKRAVEVFKKLKMHKTKQRNGVLFYIAVKDSKLAIWGDKGIHDHLGQSFWDSELKIMQEYFRKGDYFLGLKLALIEVTAKLKELYPYSLDDINELSNDISIGEGL